MEMSMQQNEMREVELDEAAMVDGGSWVDVLVVADAAYQLLQGIAAGFEKPAF
jgi:hypothetical protein